MSGVELNHTHRRGLISTPVLPTRNDVQNWLDRHWDCEDADADRYTPPLKGSAALGFINWTPQELAERGKVIHLNKYEDGSDKAIDWEYGIRVAYINQVYATAEHDDGFVAVINANFRHAIVEPAIQGSMFGRVDPKTGEPVEATREEIRNL